jgi:hypothetical protein
MANDAALDSTSATAGLSQVERVVDVFVAPSKTFKDILRSSAWWLPCLLMVIFSLATAFVVDRQVGFDRVYQNQLNASPKAQDQMNQLAPDQRATRIAISVAFTKYISYSIPILLIVGFAFYALILWACFNFILGAQTSFGQVFATCFYASLPYLLVNVLVILTLYFGGNAEAYDYKYPAGTNLGYYLPDVTPWLRALLARLDVIQLWTLGLVIYGMSIISKKTVVQSAMIVGTLWLMVTLFSMGGAALAG